jgi:predicted AlkP superfamily pyrophosphatase or phosphodiesterase
VDDLASRFEKALQLVNESEDSINYLYVPELDKFGHVNGWQSPGWALQLEVIASHLEKLAKRLPKDVGLVITADHGMIDSLDDQKIELAEVLDPIGIDFYGGDTRTALVYLKDATATDEAKRLLSGSRFFNSYTPQELTDWYGGFGKEAMDRLPELILVAKGEHTLYHSGFSKPKSYRMIAHHGAFSNAELKIPLVRVGI